MSGSGFKGKKSKVGHIRPRSLLQNPDFADFPIVICREETEGLHHILKHAHEHISERGIRTFWDDDGPEKEEKRIIDHFCVLETELRDIRILRKELVDAGAVCPSVDKLPETIIKTLVGVAAFFTGATEAISFRHDGEPFPYDLFSKQIDEDTIFDLRLFDQALAELDRFLDHYLGEPLCPVECSRSGEKHEIRVMDKKGKFGPALPYSMTEWEAVKMLADAFGDPDQRLGLRGPTRRGRGTKGAVPCHPSSQASAKAPRYQAL